MCLFRQYVYVYVYVRVYVYGKVNASLYVCVYVYVYSDFQIGIYYIHSYAQMSNIIEQDISF